MSRVVIWDKEYQQYEGEGGMHQDALKDAKVFHERSKRTIERYGKSSRYTFIPVMIVEA